MGRLTENKLVLLVLLAALCSGLLLAGCASGSAAPETSSAASEQAAEAASADEQSAESATEDASQASGALGIEEATKLIGEIKTKDELEAILGPSKRFEMSSEGCERGVYAGIFYYDDYTVYSRTYDKGGTFTIVSASE